MQSITVPDSPRQLKEDTAVRTTTKVGATWSAPSVGSVDGFLISITGSGMSVNRHLGTSVISQTFDNVEPGAEYTIRLKSKWNELVSSEVSQKVTASK